MNELKGMNCQECSEPLSFLLSFLDGVELSLQSRAHFVDLIVQKWSERFSVLRFKVINYFMTMWLTYAIELLLQPRAHFVDLIVQKWSDAVSFFPTCM